MENKSCAKCGKAFGCGAQDPRGCWCLQQPVAQDIPKKYKDCLCPDCLKEFSQKKQSLAENEDFYFENGLMVFTAKYHLKRGSCCGSGCRHCPYPQT